MTLKTKFIYQNQIFVAQFDTSTLNKIQIRDFFEKEIKSKFNLQEDTSRYILFSFKAQEINDQKLSALRLMGHNLVAVLDKEEYDDALNYFNTTFPSLLYTSTEIPNTGIELAKKINLTRDIFLNSIKPENVAFMMSLMPMAKLDKKKDIDLVQDVMEWFKLRYNFENNVFCSFCQSKTRFFKEDKVTLSERDLGAIKTNVFQCPNCGALVRKPRFLNAYQIDKSKFSIPDDCVFLMLAALKAVLLEVRIVLINRSFHCIEFWAKSQQRFVHVDPYQFVVDAPLIYDKVWGIDVNSAIAIGLHECIDVSLRYVQNSNKITSDEVCSRIIKVRDVMFQTFIKSEQEKNAIINRQEQDSFSMEAKENSLQKYETIIRRPSPLDV